MLYIDYFLLDSDIDLVAWGISSEVYLQAVSRVDDYSEEFEVDLVDPNFSRSGLRGAIDREGIDV